MSTTPSVGVNLPHGVPGVTGETLLTWARDAERLGFSSIGINERIVYANVDAVVTLAAAAAVTEHIRVMGNIFIAAVRPPALFAKEMASLSLLAPGRFTLGVGVGARPQDHAAVQVEWEERGKLVDASLDALAALGEPDDFPHSIGPVPDPNIEILIGGASKGAIRRLLRHGHGFVGGGVNAEFTGHDIATVKGAWAEAGREGAPRIVAGSWFCSAEREREANEWRTTYLAQGGPPDFVLGPIGTGADGVREVVESYAAAGATEVVLLPCSDHPDELHWLAEVLSDHLNPR